MHKFDTRQLPDVEFCRFVAWPPRDASFEVEWVQCAPVRRGGLTGQDEQLIRGLMDPRESAR
jgi:hypothetical protein